MQSEWNIKIPSAEDKQASRLLMDELQISRAEADMLVYRGITTSDAARDFLSPSLSSLHDPFLMKDMDKAVGRLTRALDNAERILIYGDYDVDGTTSVALMYRFLSTITPNLRFYIPDRYTEGYGVSLKGIDYAAEEQCSLIIALDCGIKAVDKVDYAKLKGIDFIICDHHTPDEKLPAAVAVLDPKRADCTYPYKELSGCGVGFKLLQAFCQTHGRELSELMPLFELLAMSIASDIVPITGENRVLAHYGLRQINTSPSVGLKSILEVAGIAEGEVGINDLVYKVGPRINASGRMKSGKEAVELLITQDKELAQKKSADINSYNEQRREFDKQTTEEALAQLKLDPDNDSKTTTVVYSPGWNKGVVGIVASRLTETYYRPTIVLTDSDDEYISGSARSAGGFDIYSAIDSCRDLLSNFGGHVYAAGLSMRRENLDEFKRRFEQYVSEHIRPEQRRPIINIESKIEFGDITIPFFSTLEKLQPFGPGNPVPVFVTCGAFNSRNSRLVGKQSEHLRLEVSDNTGSITGIAFGRADMAPCVLRGDKIDLCYRVEKNVYNGRFSLQIMVADLKPSC